MTHVAYYWLYVTLCVAIQLTDKLLWPVLLFIPVTGWLVVVMTIGQWRCYCTLNIGDAWYYCDCWPQWLLCIVLCVWLWLCVCVCVWPISWLTVCDIPLVWLHYILNIVCVFIQLKTVYCCGLVCGWHYDSHNLSWPYDIVPTLSRDYIVWAFSLIFVCDIDSDSLSYYTILVWLISCWPNHSVSRYLNIVCATLWPIYLGLHNDHCVTSSMTIWLSVHCVARNLFVTWA